MPVARKVYAHIRDCSHAGDILRRVVAHPEGSVADAAGDADKLDVRVRIRDINLGLLKASGRKERCGRCRKRLLSCLSQTGGNTDKILLRNTDFYRLLRIGVEESSQGCASSRIAAQYNDILVVLCLLHQNFTDNLSVRNLIH